MNRRLSAKHRIPNRPARAQRGTSTIEFALIAPVLFLLICIAFDLGVALWVNLTMQYAVREGARYAVTGRSNLDPAASNQQRYLAVLQEIKDSSMGLYNLVSPSYTITVNGTKQSYAGAGSYSSGMFGNPGDIVVLQINCVWPLLTPMVQPFFAAGNFNFSVAATMRNEGF
ncbi:TadE/TadG family type IV pilus assembly protein [Paraburkholderia sp.]|uniref:TadE/TadG family type IV pilus assembly protein n=1 Tax=Paraburkholderia sp. TaxID=1926495 RepID=UPI002391655F|nr:TadE/TadG family type IV pilus assembly protein [Paraburkholderia sp.]MDE1181679.1 TadE/TadG family type IV pilus assembly protein [Paraburkholderia sp.]